jgi:hypothetical protein
MISRKPTYFRNALDLRDKVQVRVLRRRLKLTDEQFAGIVREKQALRLRPSTRHTRFAGLFLIVQATTRSDHRKSRRHGKK